MDDSQRRELNHGLFNRSSGSFELVLAPLVLALGGLWLDGRVGTRPLITVFLVLFGFVGAFCKQYFDYRSAMAKATQQRVADSVGREVAA